MCEFRMSGINTKHFFLKKNLNYLHTHTPIHDEFLPIGPILHTPVAKSPQCSVLLK